MADAGGVFGTRRGRLRRHEPAGIGGTGENAIRLAEQQPHHSVLASTERQTPARRQIEQARMTPDLGQHRSEAAAAEPLLEHPKGVCCFGNADDDQAARIEAEAGETGAIRKSCLACGGSFDDPQDRAIILDCEAGKNGDGETGHGGGVAALRAAHLVERGTAKATGQHVVEFGNGERENGSSAARRQGGRSAREACGNLSSALSLRHARAFVARNKQLACFVRCTNRSSPFQLGDPAAQAGKAAPCHENARAHGFQTRR